MISDEQRVAGKQEANASQGQVALVRADNSAIWLSMHYSKRLVTRYLSLVTLFALALALRLYQLDTQSLWIDELNTWWLVRTRGWATLLGELWQGESAYPLYHLLLKGWTWLFGESEWALRFPSALAGALAVVAIALAGEELAGDTDSRLPTFSSLAFRPSSLIMLTSPFALWYAQEVKTYGLLLLSSTLTLWLLLHALRRNTYTSWLVLGSVALTSLFVHRFALLLLLGCCAALIAARAPEWRHKPWALPVAGTLLLAASTWLVGQMVDGMGSEGAASGAHIPATPIQAVWITLWRFALDRGPNEAPWPLLLPAGALAIWGIVLLLRDAWQGKQAARALLCCALLPTAIFLVQLWWTRLYEPRYLIIVFPCWLLTLSYPFGRQEIKGKRQNQANPMPIAFAPAQVFVFRLWSFVLLTGVLAANTAMLFQPEKGLWSGAPVKEQYREAVRYVVERAHPSAAVVLHPEYLRPAWNYYAPRFSHDPLPAPISFDAFKQGQTQFGPKDWNRSRDEQLRGYDRSYLIIAPPHASTVDKPLPGDLYGLVGLYYEYSAQQSKWPCGGVRFNGVHVWCQSSPEGYSTGQRPQPVISLPARFGEQINFLGYSIAPFGQQLRPGGRLPITLFWDVTRQPTNDYFVFLHLCRDCSIPPAASDDGPPVGGGIPTSTWLPRKPVHDERSIVLPADLPPGRYTLLLGLYRPGDPSLNARLPISGAPTLNNNRLVLGEVEISAP